jgi:NTE family protein
MARDLGLVLSGGGARGAFHVGVYECLLGDRRFERGPSVLAGTSSGAINAALIVAGKTPDEIMAFWNSLADDPPVTANEAFVQGAVRALVRQAGRESLDWVRTTRPLRAFVRRALPHLRPGPSHALAFSLEYLLIERFDLVSDFLETVSAPFLMDTSRLRARLVEVFGGDRVPAGERRLAVNAVDARSGRVVRYVTARTERTAAPEYVVVDAITVDMLLASASIPLLFAPVRIDSHLLWDGGLLVNTPLAPVVKLGAHRVIPVLVTEPVGETSKSLRGFGQALERTLDTLLENTYNLDRTLLLERNRARGRGRSYRRVVLYKPIRPASARCFTAGSYVHFNRDALAAMRVAGRQAACDWLEQDALEDRLEGDGETADA